MRPPPRAQARRRHLAALACLLWLAGVEVLPGMHVWHHDQLAGHRHHAGDASSGDGELVTRVHHGHGAHAHDGVVHLHGGVRDAAPPGESAAPTEPGPAGAPHGDHSLAHGSLALLAAPPIVDTPLPVDHRPLAVTHVIAQLIAEVPPPARAARGPPG